MSLFMMMSVMRIASSGLRPCTSARTRSCTTARKLMSFGSSFTPSSDLRLSSLRLYAADLNCRMILPVEGRGGGVLVLGESFERCRSVVDCTAATVGTGIPHSVILAMVSSIGGAEVRIEDRFSSAGGVETG